MSVDEGLCREVQLGLEDEGTDVRVTFARTDAIGASGVPTLRLVAPSGELCLVALEEDEDTTWISFRDRQVSVPLQEVRSSTVDLAALIEKIALGRYRIRRKLFRPTVKIEVATDLGRVGVRLTGIRSERHE